MNNYANISTSFFIERVYKKKLDADENGYINGKCRIIVGISRLLFTPGTSCIVLPLHEQVMIDLRIRLQSCCI